MSQNQTYSFYKIKGEHPNLDTSRVYPFSHQYGANIAIKTSPLAQRFLSAGANRFSGVLAKDVSVADYFGTTTPKIEPLYVLTYEGNPLGIRFRATPRESAFLFDVELGKLTESLQQLLLSQAPQEEMVLNPDGNFTTKLEQEQRLYVVDISECMQLIDYLNKYQHN